MRSPRSGFGRRRETVEWPEVDDVVLVVAIGRWEEAALAEAYRRHGGSVFALAKRLLHDGRAEEITQDVFLRLWERPERFEPGRGSLRSFLLAQTHGRAVDRLRQDTARDSRQVRESRLQPRPEYDLEAEVWDLTRAEQVKDALAALDDKERTAIELAYFGGLTYRQVASVLDEPEGTVKSRIRSGLRRLQAALLARNGEETR